MYAQVERPKEIKSRAVANSVEPKSIQNRNIIEDCRESFGAIQRKIEAKITKKGVEFDRNGELIRMIGDHKFKTGNVYRHMTPKSLRADAGEKYIRDLLEADPNANQLVKNASGLIEDIQNRADNWELFSEEKGDQFLGEKERNAKISDSYDSIMFEYIFANQQIDKLAIIRDAGALVRHYAFKLMRDNKTDDIMAKLSDSNNWPQIIGAVRNDISTELNKTAQLIELEKNHPGETQRCIDEIYNSLNAVPNGEIGLIKQIISGAQGILRDQEKVEKYFDRFDAHKK